MATSPNFNWPEPDNTDLVKNGALAIRTAVNAIDTSLVDLKGGTTGQVLAKASGTDMDFSWVAQDDSNAIQNAIVDAKGDLIAATANDTPARLAVGANGTVLTADSAETTGLKWAAPASGGGLTLLATTTLTGGSVTVSSLSGYKELWFVLRDAYVASNTYIELRFNSDAGSNYTVKWLKGVNTTLSTDGYIAGTTGRVGFIGDSSAAVYKLQGIIRVAAVNQTSGVSYVANTGFNDGTGHTTAVMNGSYNGTAVISSMTLFSGASTFSGGTLMTYGVN